MGTKKRNLAEEKRAARENGLAGKMETADLRRRRIVLAGAGGVGILAAAGLVGYRAGWFKDEVRETASPLPVTTATPGQLPPLKLAADRANAIRATTELVAHYTNQLRNASSAIHALRGMGRRFSLQDGSNIVDYLTSTFMADREVNGRRYVYVPREFEVHDNSFLKTFLEAGVSPAQVITAKGGNRYSLADLGESAKALFRFDPGNLRRYDPEFPEHHMPWCLIAFSRLAPATNPAWTNAYGEKIDLNDLIDIGLTDFESVCNKLASPGASTKGTNLNFRGSIVKYSCYGMHAFYGFFSAYQNGYRVNNYEKRVKTLLSHLIDRLDHDVAALEEESAAARTHGQQYIGMMGRGADGKRRGEGAPPAELIDVMSLKYYIVTIGHALEALNFVRLNRLLPITPGQNSVIDRHEQRLFEGLTRMRGYNLDTFFRWDPKFVSDIVIGLSHALRGLKLLGPDNPDNVF